MEVTNKTLIYLNSAGGSTLVAWQALLGCIQVENGTLILLGFTMITTPGPDRGISQQPADLKMWSLY